MLVEEHVLWIHATTIVLIPVRYIRVVVVMQIVGEIVIMFVTGGVKVEHYAEDPTGCKGNCTSGCGDYLQF